MTPSYETLFTLLMSKVDEVLPNINHVPRNLKLEDFKPSPRKEASWNGVLIWESKAFTYYPPTANTLATNFELAMFHFESFSTTIELRLMPHASRASIVISTTWKNTLGATNGHTISYVAFVEEDGEFCHWQRV